MRNAERLGACVNAACNDVKLEHLQASTSHPQIAKGAPEAPDAAA